MRLMLFACLFVFSLLLNMVKSETRCKYQNQYYRHGEEWDINSSAGRRSFVMRCEVKPNMWMTKVVGCYTLMDELMRVGTERSDRHGRWACVQDDRSVRLVQKD